jgi:hypothetical protein
MAARNLYCSDWFNKARAYVEAQNKKWFILSGKYHLLRPTAVIEPYESTLNKMSRDERLIWAKKVQTSLKGVCQPGDSVIILAGLRYREHLASWLKERGCHVEVPLRRMGIGKQLHWFKQRLSHD